MRLIIAALAAGTCLLLLTSMTSAASGVHITALDCGSHPRRIRIENQGDTAQDLTGWQLRSDSVEGQPWDLSEVGSIPAGGKFFVFQGHLSPAVNPSLGYYRWGTDEIFNLRANDSSDYVRIVDAQGNTVDQRNCEGLAPGATPAPTSEYDPPALATATVAPTAAPATPTPAGPAGSTARATTRPAGSTRATARATTRASGATIGVGGGLPVGGGRPPGVDHSDERTALAAGAILLVAGTFLTTLAAKRARPRA